MEHQGTPGNTREHQGTPGNTSGNTRSQEQEPRALLYIYEGTPGNTSGNTSPNTRSGSLELLQGGARAKATAEQEKIKNKETYII